MATCGSMIEGNVVAYGCDLDQGHTGPHRAVENPRSVRERVKWEADQAHLASGLGQFQGIAETTAQRYTENPTDVPGPKYQQPEPETLPENFDRFATPVVLEEKDTGEVKFRQATTAEAKVAGIDLGAVIPEVGHIYLMDITRLDIDGIFDGPSPTQAKMTITQIDLSSETGQRFRMAFSGHPGQPGPEFDFTRKQFKELAKDRVLTDDEKFQMLSRVRKDEVENPESEVENPESKPIKQREGDQPLPTQTGGEFVQDRIIEKVEALKANGSIEPDQAEKIIEQMENSKAVGMQRYGSALQTFNGRDTLQDAAEEARDLFVYLNSLVQARESQRDHLIDVVEDAILKHYPSRPLALAAIVVDTILNATGPL